MTTQNPLGCTILGDWRARTCADTCAYMRGRRPVRPHTHNSGLSSFITPMHRCRVCYWLMENNLSKSVVALRQPFSPNVTFKGSSMLAHYCSKATEPRNCLGQLNEAPLWMLWLNGPWCSNKSPDNLALPLIYIVWLRKRAKPLFSPISLLLNWLWYCIV